ncbi:MAG: hypothetical protein ACOX0C_01490 [Patescibacteria group bacterium]
MKKELILKIVFYLIIALSVLFIINKINKYLDARVQYENIECHNRAYIIYKQHDDQNYQAKNRDWSLRNTECSQIEAKYQRGF